MVLCTDKKQYDPCSYIRIPYQSDKIETKENAEAWLVSPESEEVGAYLYIPWHNLLLELSTEGYHALQTFSENGLECPTLVEIQKLLQNSPVPLSRSRDSEEFAPTLVGLGLTDLCSLRCIYCHSDAGPTDSNQQLPYEIAEAALRLVANNAKRLERKFEVAFTGPGEPTMAWNLLKRCTNLAYQLADELGLELELTMATNGYYGDEKRSFIIENFNGVSLSLDGIERIQNLHRPSVGGKDSFQKVIETARYFYDSWGKGKKGFRFAIRSTVSNESLKHLDEIHEFFKGSFPEVRTAYEALNPLGRGTSCFEGEVTFPDQASFSSTIVRLVQSSGSNQVVNSGASRIGELKRSFCKALAMPSMNVNPDGQLVACQRDGAPEYYAYGAYDKTTQRFVLDHDKIQHFRNLTVETYAECEDCIAKYHCAGDCNDLRRTGVNRCNTNQQLVQTFLRETICN